MKQDQRFKGKFKQGQTAYAIHLDFSMPEVKMVMKSYYLHSHKSPLPKQGELITKMNESYLNWVTSNIDTFIVYKSKRKALSRLKVEQRFWDNEFTQK